MTSHKTFSVGISLALTLIFAFCGETFAQNVDFDVAGYYSFEIGRAHV